MAELKQVTGNYFWETFMIPRVNGDWRALLLLTVIQATGAVWSWQDGHYGWCVFNAAVASSNLTRLFESSR